MSSRLLRYVTICAILGATLSTSAANVRDFGAIGDGVADDTVAIQRAIDEAREGQSHGVDIELGPGVFRITRTIVIDLSKRGPVSIRGRGSAQIVMAGEGPAFRFVGTHEGTAAPSTVDPSVWQRERMPLIDGFAIEGAHADAVGIEAAGTMGLVVTRLHIRNCLHGIHLRERNRNVIIGECHIYENRGVGVYYDAVNLHQSNIANSHISYCRGGGVVSRGGDVRNIQITGCDIEGNMHPDAPPTANVLLDSRGGSIGEVAVTGCTIQHDHDAPGSANIRVIGASADRPFTDERRSGNITIANNVLSDVAVNIDLVAARGIAVVGNTIWKGYEHDIRVAGCRAVMLANNVLNRNPRYHYGDGATARHGVVVRESEDVSLLGNQIVGTGRVEAAVVIESSRRVNISACTIVDHEGAGLVLRDVTDSLVTGCLIRDDREGVDASTSIRVTRGHGNRFADNLLGGAIEGAENESGN